MLAHEIFDTLRKKKWRKKGYGALKFDMSKAYDKVNWNFSHTWIKLMIRLLQFNILYSSMAAPHSLSTLLEALDRGVLYLPIFPYTAPISSQLHSLKLKTKGRLKASQWEDKLFHSHTYFLLMTTFFSSKTTIALFPTLRIQSCGIAQYLVKVLTSPNLTCFVHLTYLLMTNNP